MLCLAFTPKRYTTHGLSDGKWVTWKSEPPNPFNARNSQSADVSAGMRPWTKQVCIEATCKTIKEWKIVFRNVQFCCFSQLCLEFYNIQRETLLSPFSFRILMAKAFQGHSVWISAVSLHQASVNLIYLDKTKSLRRSHISISEIRMPLKIQVLLTMTFWTPTSVDIIELSFLLPPLHIKQSSTQSKQRADRHGSSVWHHTDHLKGFLSSSHISGLQSQVETRSDTMVSPALKHPPAADKHVLNMADGGGLTISSSVNTQPSPVSSVNIQWLELHKVIGYKGRRGGS